MKNLSKRQQKRIDYFLREKESRRAKQELIHNEELPKFIEKQIPYVRRLSRNIDNLLIVASFVSPPFKPGLVDRLLIIADLEEVEPIICLNKSDLVDDPDIIKKAVQIYLDIGYKVIVTSAKTGVGIRELNDLIRGKKSALSGHSGVGKSSLLNAIEPNLQIEEGDVSSWNNKGKHTTTKVTTYTLDDNSVIYDLPGMKKVSIIDIRKEDVRFYFREFENFAEDCKFTNCLHLSEHNCAVKNAVEKGLIARERYKSYYNLAQCL